MHNDEKENRKWEEELAFALVIQKSDSQTWTIVVRRDACYKFHEADQTYHLAKHCWIITNLSSMSGTLLICIEAENTLPSPNARG